MSASPTLYQTPCVVRQVHWAHPTMPCDRCQQPARRVGTATRTAIDLDLDGPVLLAVTVRVHRCAACQHAFRAQPPVLRPDAIYTNRVVATAVHSVCWLKIRPSASRSALVGMVQAA